MKHCINRACGAELENYQRRCSTEMENHMTSRLRKMEMHHNLRLVLCFFFFYLCVQTSGQIVIEADSVVQLGQTLRLRYQYNAKDSTEKIVSPSWDWGGNSGYEVLTGPSHFKYRTTTTFGETFIFSLSFKKEGYYSMPAMKAQTSSGKNISSKPFTIRAAKENVMHSKNDLLVVDVIADKNHITTGDSIECEIRLYTNLPVSYMSSSFKSAINSAYWRELQIPTDNTWKRVAYNGDSIQSFLWKKNSIIPMQAGDVELGPLQFEITFLSKNPDFSLSNLSRLFIPTDTIITTAPVTIHVEGDKLSAKDIVFSGEISFHNMGLVIDRSSSLTARRDSLAPTFSQHEDLFLEQLIKGKALSDYSTTLFAGKVHYLNSAQPSGFKQFPSKGNDGSAIYNAILASALRDGALTTDHPPYSILLLTDGSDNMSRISEKTLTELLLRHNIRIDVIAFASNEDYIYYASNDSVGTCREKNKQDYSDVKRIADNTNGAFILVDNKNQIPAAIHKILGKILKKEKPKQQPSESFLPERALLYTLCEEIFTEAKSDF